MNVSTKKVGMPVSHRAIKWTYIPIFSQMLYVWNMYIAFTTRNTPTASIWYREHLGKSILPCGPELAPWAIMYYHTSFNSRWSFFGYLSLWDMLKTMKRWKVPTLSQWQSLLNCNRIKYYNSACTVCTFHSYSSTPRTSISSCFHVFSRFCGTSWLAICIIWTISVSHCFSIEANMELWTSAEDIGCGDCFLGKKLRIFFDEIT